LSFNLILFLSFIFLPSRVFAKGTSLVRSLNCHRSCKHAFELIALFGNSILSERVFVQKVPYLYKTTSKEFEFLHKGYATAVAMATMAFQDGGYFGFKVI
jgi:hypothetical protein